MKHVLKKTNQNIIKLLYQLVYDVKRIFELYKIKYWAIGGTFLGAVRHKGIIPWDDDADIGILNTDVKRFLSLKNMLLKIGYKITKMFFGYKIFYANRPLGDFQYSFPNLDIFVYKKVDNKYVQYYKEARETWTKEFYTSDQIENLQKMDFGSYKISCPSNYKAYMDRYFGPDWNVIAYREYDHSKEEEVEKIKVHLTEKDRVPAQPINKVINRKIIKNLCSMPRRTKSIGTYVSKRRSRKISSDCQNFSVKMGTYVINCPVHKERLERFKTYAKRAGLKFCIEKCVNGSDFTPAMICKLESKKIVSKKATITPTELAICLSHYNTWVRILNSGDDYGLIFEDDCHFSSDIVEQINGYMDEIMGAGIKFDTFYLFNGNWGKEYVSEGLERVTKNIYREKITFNAGGVAYIISKSFCEKICKEFFPISDPQDLWLGSLKGTHLTIKMKYNRKDKCYNNDTLVWVDCFGEGGTGNSTQTYDAITIDKLSCDKC